MKKKFAAAFVAFALAMAMPAAAFAEAATDEDAAAINPSPTAQPVLTQKNTSEIDTTAQGNGMTAIGITGKTKNVYANNFGTTQAASKANAASYASDKTTKEQNKLQDAYDDAVADIQKQIDEDPFADTEALNQKIADLTTQLAIDKNAVDSKWANAENNYNKAVNKFASIDGNNVINTFELQGDSEGSMVITLKFDEKQYAGHTVTALILDENGNIIEKTMVVDKNGCIKIEKDGFCVWTLVDCSGGLPAGTVVEGVSTSDFEKALSVAGNATDQGTSPKTGC